MLAELLVPGSIVFGISWRLYRGGGVWRAARRIFNKTGLAFLTGEVRCRCQVCGPTTDRHKEVSDSQTQLTHLHDK